MLRTANVLLLLLTTIPLPLAAAETWERLPLFFEENRGQADPEPHFFYTGPVTAFWPVERA